LRGWLRSLSARPRSSCSCLSASAEYCGPRPRSRRPEPLERGPHRQRQYHRRGHSSMPLLEPRTGRAVYARREVGGEEEGARRPISQAPVMRGHRLDGWR
jgi:hypothetical protein